MTKRLFYTCPIKALYMMQEFGIEFEAEEDGEFYDFGGWGVNAETIAELLDNFGKYYPEKIYVKKESEIIFEPADRDVAVVQEGLFTRAYEYQKPSHLHPNGAWLHNGFKYDTNVLRTTWRDGKQFFAPEMFHSEDLKKSKKEEKQND